MNRAFVGDDWAEGHHDTHVTGSDGSAMRACRLVEGLEDARSRIGAGRRQPAAGFPTTRSRPQRR